MASKFKKILQKSLVTKQDFSYSKEGTNLAFTLRTDNSSELRNFKSLLEEGIKDIDIILERMKN